MLYVHLNQLLLSCRILIGHRCNLQLYLIDNLYHRKQLRLIELEYKLNQNQLLM